MVRQIVLNHNWKFPCHAPAGFKGGRSTLALTEGVVPIEKAGRGVQDRQTREQ